MYNRYSKNFTQDWHFQSSQLWQSYYHEPHFTRETLKPVGLELAQDYSAAEIEDVNPIGLRLESEPEPLRSIRPAELTNLLRKPRKERRGQNWSSRMALALIQLSPPRPQGKTHWEDFLKLQVHA